MRKEKKKKGRKEEKYIPVRGIIGDMPDYHIYKMTAFDRISASFFGFLAAGIIIYVFFRSIFPIFPTGVAAAFLAQGIYRDFKKKKRLKELLLQFKDLLESLSSSYSAGENTLAAFKDAESDLISIYGEGADIVTETKAVVNGLANNRTVEELLQNFALRSGLEDVESFANVFEAANRQGSNLKQVISESREIINDKIEIEMEIETMLAGNKNELNVMMLMPLVIVMSLSGMGTGTIVNNSWMNVMIKIGCIALFLFAYKLGMKVVDIKI